MVNYSVGFYLVKRSQKLGSIVLEADGKHLMVDAYSTFGLLVGLLVLKLTNLAWIDIAISLIMGIFILWNGYKLLRKSIGGLMDESDIETLEQVTDILNKNRREQWIDIHNFRIQRYGNELHIDCHLTLPNYYTLTEVHDQLSQLDTIINKELGVPTELFVHADPCLPACCNYCNVQNCPIRSFEKKYDVEWTSKNITLNMKHFSSNKFEKKE